MCWFFRMRWELVLVRRTVRDGMSIIHLPSSWSTKKCMLPLSLYLCKLFRTIEHWVYYLSQWRELPIIVRRWWRVRTEITRMDESVDQVVLSYDHSFWSQSDVPNNRCCLSVLIENIKETLSPWWLSTVLWLQQIGSICQRRIFER